MSFSVLKSWSIIFGGVSFEHEISIVSAISLKKVLGDKIKHFIFLDSSHSFYDIAPEKMQAKTFASGEYKSCKKLSLGLGGFYEKGFLGAQKPISDLGIALNLIHGADGEDGTLASIFDFYKIPFIGPRIEASVISFNKILTKIYVDSLDKSRVKTLPFCRYHRDDLPYILDGSKPIAFPYPFIIKPARLGSSIGITIVNKQSEVEYALDSAFELDDSVIVEPFYKGVREYNLAGFLGIKDGVRNTFIFSQIEEPIKKDLLDFNDKYLDFSRTDNAPKAQIDSSLESRLQEAFKIIYGKVFEGALIRCDFFVIDDEIYLNEINPIPGSLANYLFDNLEKALESIHLPRNKNIPITYAYVEHIRKTKGK